jgi:hypothetical protein
LISIGCIGVLRADYNRRDLSQVWFYRHEFPVNLFTQHCSRSGADHRHERVRIAGKRAKT